MTWTDGWTHARMYASSDMFMMTAHKVDICDLEIRPRWPTYNSRQAIHEGYPQTKIGDPSSFCSQVISVTSRLWWIHKGDLSELESGSRWPTSILSSFSMRDTYTPNLVIPGQFVPNIVSRKQIVSNSHKVHLCDIESGSRWPTYNPKQFFH